MFLLNSNRNSFVYHFAKGWDKQDFGRWNVVFLAASEHFETMSQVSFKIFSQVFAGNPTSSQRPSYTSHGKKACLPRTWWGLQIFAIFSKWFRSGSEDVLRILTPGSPMKGGRSALDANTLGCQICAKSHAKMIFLKTSRKAKEVVHKALAKTLQKRKKRKRQTKTSIWIVEVDSCEVRELEPETEMALIDTDLTVEAPWISSSLLISSHLKLAKPFNFWCLKISSKVYSFCGIAILALKFLMNPGRSRKRYQTRKFTWNIFSGSLEISSADVLFEPRHVTMIFVFFRSLRDHVHGHLRRLSETTLIWALISLLLRLRKYQKVVNDV